MGVLTDLMEARIVQLRTRAIKSFIERHGDPDYPAGYEAIDEVQQLTANTATGGTQTLTFLLANGETFTTAGIAYNADASTVLAAISTAATGVVTGWTDGDIAVTGGPLNSATTTFTYSGPSVDGQQHEELTVNGAGLTGGSAGTPSTPTPGQTRRLAWAALKVLHYLTSGLPEQGVTPSSLVATLRVPLQPLDIDRPTLQAIARQAALEDNNDAVDDEILEILNLYA